MRRTLAYLFKLLAIIGMCKVVVFKCLQFICICLLFGSNRTTRDVIIDKHLCLYKIVLAFKIFFVARVQVFLEFSRNSRSSDDVWQFVWVELTFVHTHFRTDFIANFIDLSRFNM